jgi:hypothetical protein
MLTEFIFQFFIDVLRTLLIEATCLHVHKGTGKLRLTIRSRKVQEDIKGRVNARVRARLIHRLTTEQDR